MKRIALAGLLLALSSACGSNGGAATASASASASSSSTGGGASASSGTGGAGGAGGPSPACVQQAADLQDLLDTSKPKAAPGAILAVTTPDCGTWVGVSGNSTTSEPMKPDDVFRIGSTTKTFVSARVLQLVAAGTVGLDDTLEHWLPGFPGGAGITVRQLLDHTSGIFSYTDDTAFQMGVNGDPMKKWAPQELVDFAAAQPPYFAPGGGWHYSNTNYILLGMLIEKATSDTLGKQIRQNLLGPSQLTSTSFDGEEAIVGNLAHGFQGAVDVSTLIDPSYAWSAGAMVSSATDLVRWAEALYSGKILDMATMKELLTTVDTDEAGLHYGLGVFVGDPSIALDTIIGHGGDIPGYHTNMWYLPNEKITFALVVNADGADPNVITAAVLQHFLQ